MLSDACVLSVYSRWKLLRRKFAKIDAQRKGQAGSVLQSDRKTHLPCPHKILLTHKPNSVTVEERAFAITISCGTCSNWRLCESLFRQHNI